MNGWLSRILSMTVLALALAGATSGQTDRDRERAENERDLDLRSWNLKIIQLQHEKERRGRPQSQRALAQLQEDFTKLQLVNRTLLRAALADQALDQNLVGKSASEIRKRAERLNELLALPEPDRSTSPGPAFSITTEQQIKPAVLKLGRLIFSFIDNPFFKEVSVADTQITARARQDLEDIILLSREIKKSSEQFKKSKQ
jgi:hypothetical protein